jgi:RNA polymerase sigma-70 factor (sigma-E family)
MVGSAESADVGELRAYCESMWPRLVGGLALHCGDRMVAEELAQEALVRLWQRWDAVSSKGNPDGWLWTVALNLSRSKRRRRTAEQRARVRMGQTPVVTDDAPTADAVAVRDAVSALPDRQRVAVTLRYFAGLSIRQTAEAMSCAEGTVAAHTHKALDSLRDALGDEITEEVMQRD